MFNLQLFNYQEKNIVTIGMIKNLLIPRLLSYVQNQNEDEEITIPELLSILNRSYQPVDDEFTDAEINSVLQGSYQPVDDEFSDSDFIFKE